MNLERPRSPIVSKPFSFLLFPRPAFLAFVSLLLRQNLIQPWFFFSEKRPSFIFIQFSLALQCLPLSRNFHLYVVFVPHFLYLFGHFHSPLPQLVLRRRPSFRWSRRRLTASPAVPYSSGRADTSCPRGLAVFSRPSSFSWPSPLSLLSLLFPLKSKIEGEMLPYPTTRSRSLVISFDDFRCCSVFYPPLYLITSSEMLKDVVISPELQASLNDPFFDPSFLSPLRGLLRHCFLVFFFYYLSFLLAIIPLIRHYRGLFVPPLVTVAPTLFPPFTGQDYRASIAPPNTMSFSCEIVYPPPNSRPACASFSFLTIPFITSACVRGNF